MSEFSWSAFYFLKMLFFWPAWPLTKIESYIVSAIHINQSHMQNGEPQMAHVAIKMIKKRAAGPPIKTARHCLEQSHQLLLFCTCSTVNASFWNSDASSVICWVLARRRSPSAKLLICFYVALSAIYLISSTWSWAWFIVPCLIPVSLFV